MHSSQRTGPLRSRTGLALLLLLSAGSLPVAAQERIESEAVGRARLESAPLPFSSWLYRSSSQSLPDRPPPVTAQWQPQSSLLRAGETPSDWAGAGWFVAVVDLEANLTALPLALRFQRHYGASRIFLDGVLLAEIGRASLDPATLVPELGRAPILFEVQSAGAHEIAIHFVNPEWERYHRVGYPAGFFVQLAEANGAIASRVAESSRFAGRRGLFAGIFLSFALLHFLLFAFRPQGRENLDFAVLCTSLAALAFLLAHKGLVDDPRIVFWSEGAMNVAALSFALFGVRFVHRVFSGATPATASSPLPRWLRWASLALVPVMMWSVVRPGAAIGPVFLLMLLALLEMARCVTLAVLRRTPGARIVGLGILALALGFGAGVLATMGVLPGIPALTFVVPFASVLLLIVSMSVYLSRRYARTQRDLEHQIEQVRLLSEDKLREERRLREQMIQNELLEAEVARRDEELEEARQLQLSMLPQEIPTHPRAELAAHMETATEVGGDYYDFDLGKDGVLTLAIGDATGHGMRAGTMVTATKSLFNALGGDPDILATVKRSNLALKRMNLRNLNMAFLLARFHDGQLRVTAAGMPQPLIHRAASNEVEALEVGGMPMGSISFFPYQTVDVELGVGDTVLFMSDGFPERANPEGEQIGYERATELFSRVARQSSQAVIDHLVRAGDDWAEGAPPDDDVTFLVLSVH